MTNKRTNYMSSFSFFFNAKVYYITPKTEQFCRRSVPYISDLHGSRKHMNSLRSIIIVNAGN